MVCDAPSAAGPLNCGLQAEGVPLEVIDRRTATATDFHSMAMALSDRVTITDSECVRGLERRVIVGVEGRIGVLDRLEVMSRCTSQIVWIGTPGDF